MKSLGDDETVDGHFRLGTGYVPAVEGKAVHLPAHEGGRASADHGAGMVRVKKQDRSGGLSVAPVCVYRLNYALRL